MTERGTVMKRLWWFIVAVALARTLGVVLVAGTFPAGAEAALGSSG